MDKKDREYTFGEETEEQTIGRQEQIIKNDLSVYFNVVDPTKFDISSARRMDPRSWIDEARLEFFRAAARSGLNPHEALHSWGEGIDVEGTAITNVTAQGYCAYEVAKRQGITVDDVLSNVRRVLNPPKPSTTLN